MENQGEKQRCDAEEGVWDMTGEAMDSRSFPTGDVLSDTLYNWEANKKQRLRKMVGEPDRAPS